MPELPEVQTTVDGLQKTVVGFSITNVWTDLAIKDQRIPHYKNTLKDLNFFNYFKKETIGRKIKKAERRAKNILIHLENKQTILVHMKMTGHMMFGLYEYNKKTNSWSVNPKEKNAALRDPYNRFVHVVWTLTKGSTTKHLVLCDSRKFAKVILLETLSLHSKHFKDTGPEPLDKKFSVKDFKQRLLLKPNGKVKQVLLEQSIVAGIGNIYSDEMLWLAGIHPERKIKDIQEKKFASLYKAMIYVLKKGIDFGGDSTSDYRNIDGQKGRFHAIHNVYREKNKPCKKKNCTGIIQRKIVGGRSAHFCPVHQK